MTLISHPEGPEASWLLPPAVDCHQCPVFQARSRSVIGPRVQQQGHCAAWRLQTYGEVTATHSADVHSHLVRDRWQEMGRKGGVNKIYAKEYNKNRKRDQAVWASQLVPTPTCSYLLSVK